MATKSFNHKNETYYKRQNLNDGEQWACSHKDGTETWTFIAKKNPSRAEIIEAIAQIDSEE